MSIQAGLNQTISIASLLVSQTETYKTLSENRKMTVQGKTYENRMKHAKEDGTTSSQLDLQGEITYHAFEQYKKFPSQKNYDKLAAAANEYGKLEQKVKDEAMAEAKMDDYAESVEAYEKEMEEMESWETPKAVSKSEQARAASESSLKEIQDSRRITRARQGRINTAANRRARRKEQTKLEIQKKEIKKEEQRNGKV